MKDLANFCGKVLLFEKDRKGTEEPKISRTPNLRAVIMFDAGVTGFELADTRVKVHRLPSHISLYQSISVYIGSYCHRKYVDFDAKSAAKPKKKAQICARKKYALERVAKVLLKI